MNKSTQNQLTKQQRQKMINTHKQNLDAIKANNKQQWQYDEDEENTPSQASVELKSMSLTKAIGTGANPYKESPLQNHYISAISHNCGTNQQNNAVLNYDEMFQHAFEVQPLNTRTQNPDIQVSISHASDYDSQPTQGKKSQKSSKIGTQSLAVQGSKATQNPGSQSINNEASKNLVAYLEQQEGEPQGMTSYIIAQRFEANRRKDNKVQNQLKGDHESGIMELKEFEVRKTIQIQLQSRKDRKNQEQAQAKTQGGNLESHMNSFYLHEGRQALQKQSEAIKHTGMNELYRKTKYDYADDSDQDDNFGHQIGKSHEVLKKRQMDQDQLNRDLDEAKMQLSKVIPDAYAFQTQMIDTVHPNKLQQQRNMKEVKQNMFLNRMDGHGTTGSSLGYGQNQNLNTYHLKGLGNQGAYNFESSNSIGGSQFFHTGNLVYGDHHSNTILTDTQHPKMLPKQVLNKTPNMGASAYKTPVASQMSSRQVMPTVAKQPPCNQPNFFESPSKYISLKKFTDDLNFNGAQFQESLYQDKAANKDYSLQKWFEKLMNHEKAIVMTIVDQDLVNLIKSMHQNYNLHGHGFFTNDNPNRSLITPQEIQNCWFQVKGYDLHFKLPTFTSYDGYQSQYNLYNQSQSYDFHGPSHLQVKQSTESTLIKQQQKCQDGLISALTFIKVGSEEAITLNNDFLENNSYLITMLQTVEPNFLRQELKIEKSDIQNAMSASVFYKGKNDKNEGGDDQSKYHNRKTNSRSKNQDAYFTFQNRFDQSKPQSAIDEFKQRNSNYSKMGTKPHPSQRDQPSASYLTLGQILVHLFERAVNVQYQEFQNKMTNPMKDFFFNSEENPRFEEDLRLARFWKDIKEPKMTKVFIMLTAEMEKVFVDTKKTDAYQKQQDFPEIEEVSDCMEPSFGDSDQDSGYIKKQMDPKKAQLYRQYLNESPGQWNSQMQSIQNKINKNEKMINSQTKRLKGKYVDWDGSEEETKQPVKKSGKQIVPRREPDSNDTDSNSDDIEKNKNYNKGYVLLKDSSPKRGAPGLNIPKYKKAAGKGVQALDNDSTVTENSVDSPQSQKQRETLNPIYSTKQDKREFSEGEIDPNLAHLHEDESSNYENDEFEDTDLDDDFNLPADHQQNTESFGQPKNIKEQLGKHTSKVFTNTSSQTIKKPEEQKTQKQSKSEMKVLKETLRQNDETQKETRLRKSLKDLVSKLIEQGTKAKQTQNIEDSYMFIRSISTFKSLVLAAGLEESNFIHLAISDLHHRIYQLLKSEQQKALMDDLNELDEKQGEQADKGKPVTAQKKNKKKSKKAKEASEQIQVVDDVVIISKNEGGVKADDGKGAPPPADDEDEAEAQTDQPAKSKKRNKKKKKKGPVIEEEAKKMETDPEPTNEMSMHVQKNVMSEEKRKPSHSFANDNYMTQSEDSLEHNKRQLGKLIDRHHQLSNDEFQIAKFAKEIYIDPYTDSHSNMSSLSHQQQMNEKYLAERTSLLHGEVQLNKYPEAHNESLDSIGKELSQDKDLKMFQHAEGIRKRSHAEIEEARKRINKDIKLQQVQNQELIRENDTLLADLDGLNSEFKSVTQKISQERKPELTFTDLKEERRLKHNRAVGDYSERAKEIQDEAAEGEGEAKKKKRNKKKKAKKKEKAEGDEIILPESIKEAGKIAELARKQEQEHIQGLQQQSSKWNEMLEQTLRKERMDNDDSSCGLSNQQDKDLFDDDFINSEDIHLQFEDECKKETGVIKVDLERCKQRCQMSSVYLGKINQMESASSFQNPSINSYQLSDQRKEQIMNYTSQQSSRGKQGSAADSKAEKKARLDSLFNPEPIAEIAVELPDDDEQPDGKDQQTPMLSKKKQAKAEKKKEAKQNLKLKAQQKKQEEAEMKAQKDQKRKEKQEQAKMQKQTKDSDAQMPEDDDLIEKQIITSSSKEIQLPGLSKLNEEEGRVSHVFARSKKVQFQRDFSHDGSAKVPKRGSSRGTSVASSNKNKNDDNLNQELDGLFAPEYNKPQPSLVESLNTSKKNTPDNSSSKHNKVEDLNDQILQKKLEELKIQKEEEERSKNPRSSSVPLAKQSKDTNDVDSKAQTSKKKVPDPEPMVLESKLETLNVKLFQPNKKEKVKEKQKQQNVDQNYAQILPQPSIQIIKPEPKLTGKQKKKLNKEKARQEATETEAGAKAKPSTSAPPKKPEKEAPPKSVESPINSVEPFVVGNSIEEQETKQASIIAEESKLTQKKKTKKPKQAPTENTSAPPAESKKQSQNPTKPKQEPAIGQKKLQQILSDEHIEEPIRGPQKQMSSNKKAVASGQIDTDQILRNIETYKSFNGAQNFNAMQRINGNQMPQQFNMMEQPMNWMANNQMMQQNNSMFLPPQMQQPVPDNVQQNQAGSTINIDIISISYQQNQNNQNFSQQQMLNFQNKQINQSTSPQQMLMQPNVQSNTSGQNRQPLMQFQQPIQPNNNGTNQFMLNMLDPMMASQQQQPFSQQQSPPQMFNFIPSNSQSPNQFPFNGHLGTQFNQQQNRPQFMNQFPAQLNAQNLSQMFNSLFINNMANQQFQQPNQNFAMFASNFQKQNQTQVSQQQMMGMASTGQGGSPNMAQYQQQLNFMNYMFQQMMSQQSKQLQGGFQQQFGQANQQMLKQMQLMQFGAQNKQNLMPNTGLPMQPMGHQSFGLLPQMTANLPATDLLRQSQDSQIDSTQSTDTQPTQYIPIKLKDQLDSLSEHSNIFIPKTFGPQQPFGQSSQADKFIQQPPFAIMNQMDRTFGQNQIGQLGRQFAGGQPMPMMPMMNQAMMVQHQEQQMKYQQLMMQGFIMQNCPHDHFALSGLSAQDLSHVHEFYEVLDAQIDRIKDDQKTKLRKTEKLRDIAFNLIKTKIQEKYRQKQISKSRKAKPAKVEIYGSMATGLAIDSSDLDIIVYGFIDPNSPRYQNMTRDQLVEELQMIHAALNDVQSVKDNNLIQTASVPVIKLQLNLLELCRLEKEKNPAFEIGPEHIDDETTVLHIDITLDEPKKGSSEIQHLGIQCCNYIKSKIEQYPDLKIMALLFKKFLSLKNLNKPYKGGLSSYSLIQMILTVLTAIKLENDTQAWSLSKIFKKFVWEFGFNFDPQTKAISDECQIEDRQSMNYILHSPQCNINQFFNGETYGNEEECDCGFSMTSTSDANFNIHHQFGLPTLIIVDPLNRFNNIGKSSYDFKMIQEKFREVYFRFCEELKMFVTSCSQKQNGQAGQQYDVDSMLSRILEIDYKLAKPAPTLECSPPMNSKKESKKSPPTKKLPKQEPTKEEEKLSNDEIAARKRQPEPKQPKEIKETKEPEPAVETKTEAKLETSGPKKQGKAGKTKRK